jgi:uncharacterized protein YegJ (DUF2314 family)
MGQVIWAEGDDPELREAALNARRTFRYFWREVSWENQRIVPALDLAAVKLAFSDPDHPDGVEYMWVSEVAFDGKSVKGELLNDPNKLKSVRAGDLVEQPLGRLFDWIYALDGTAHGAFSVNVLRRRMKLDERAAHDEAWGYDFGDPAKVWTTTDAEHPMALNAAPDLVERLKSGALKPNEAAADGWTWLHRLSLAGATACVEGLLANGADARLKTGHGLTALDLAQSLDWAGVIALLERRV